MGKPVLPLNPCGPELPLANVFFSFFIFFNFELIADSQDGTETMHTCPLGLQAASLCNPAHHPHSVHIPGPKPALISPVPTGPHVYVCHHMKLYHK